MLQAEMSRVRFPISILDFSIYLILPIAIWSLGLAQLLTNENHESFWG
jgi:hypothetical protein